jgi:rhodanese-related sulfurtransferase
MVFKYTEDTIFENFKYLNDIKGETVVAKYTAEGPDRVAAVITRNYVKVPRGAKELNAEQMAELVKKGPEAGGFVLIDARPAKRYEEGHIAGAVSVPVSKLKKEGAELLPSDKNIPLVFYCGGPTCGMSPKAAGIALKSGYKNVSVFLGGEPGWKKAGYCTTSTPGFIQTGNVILVDLRDHKAVTAGHIPGAVSIPSGTLDDMKSQFPSYKGAHILFYSDNIDDIRSSVRKARKWGYKKSTVFLGGVDAWTQAGLNLEKGPAASEISYVRKISPGEISIADFDQAVKSGSSVILDVRTPSEFAAGHFSGAVNIPVDDMSVRCTELPKNKTIFAHCIQGVRAEMAFNILKDKGYKVKFLKAEPVFNSDGTYEITE